MTQVLGFTTVDGTGQAGVEAYYDKYLKGVNGKNLSQGDASGVMVGGLDLYIPSIDGLNIKLTIDSKIQNKIYNIVFTKEVTCTICTSSLYFLCSCN